VNELAARDWLFRALLPPAENPNALWVLLIGMIEARSRGAPISSSRTEENPMAKKKRAIAKSAAVTKSIETALASLGTACDAGDSPGEAQQGRQEPVCRHEATVEEACDPHQAKAPIGKASQGLAERRHAPGPSVGDQGARADEDPARQGARGEGRQRRGARGAQDRAAPGDRLREGNRAGRQVARQEAVAKNERREKGRREEIHPGLFFLRALPSRALSASVDPTSSCP